MKIHSPVILVTSFFAGVLSMTVTPASAAQEASLALAPLPSLEDFSRGKNGWAFGIGLGVEYESAYEGSDEYEFEVDPAGAVQWRSNNNLVYWAGEALGWRGRRQDVWIFDAAIGFDEGRAESDSDEGRLDGLGDGDESFEAVLQIRRAFDSDWRYWLDGRIIGGSDGTLGLLGIGRRFGSKADGSGHEIALAVLFQDSDFANRDFGIDDEQAAASGFTETKLDAGFRSFGFNYNYRRYLNEHWQLFGEALYEHYSSEIQDSPLSRSDFEAEIGGGFIYVF